MIVRILIVAAGLMLIIFADSIAPALERFIERLPVPASRGEGGDEFGEDEEEDILDNKTKWKIIIIGYFIFAMVTVFSVASVITLNDKINTLYESVQRLEESSAER